MAMRARLFVVLWFCGCGDNLIPATDAGPDAFEADAQSTDGMNAECSDTVAAILAANPGSDASAYPAAGWWSDDTRANGTVVVDPSFAPPPGFGCKSAKFTTGDSTASPSADKAQLISFAKAGAPLASISTVSYWAYRSSTSMGNAAIDLALNVSVTGSTVPTGYAVLVYEPYQQSSGNAGVLVDTWQPWNATATTAGDGRWWTNKIPNGASPGNPGSQSNPQPWAAFQALYSDAVIHGYGFNLGSVNPNMVVAGDGLVFGTTTTDF